MKNFIFHILEGYTQSHTKNSIKHNFLFLAHEYLFVFKKIKIRER